MSLVVEKWPKIKPAIRTRDQVRKLAIVIECTVHYPTLSAIDAMVGCHLATAAAVAAQPSKERG